MEVHVVQRRDGAEIFEDAAAFQQRRLAGILSRRCQSLPPWPDATTERSGHYLS